MDDSERNLPPMIREAAHQAFCRAVTIAGGQTAYAKIVGVSQQYVSKRIRQRRVVPVGWIEPTETVTGVGPHELRPDLYPVDDIAPSPAPLSGTASPVVRSPVAGDAVSKHEAGA